jgi:hypothetical protein
MDKRHFTVVIGSKEHGLYVSSTPSSAAKKAVSKLCASNKSKKVEFYLREITQGSKKKTYGLYQGEMKKLKTPIELKGRVIRYETIVKLKKVKNTMKGGKSEALKDILEIAKRQFFSKNDLKNVNSRDKFFEKMQLSLPDHKSASHTPIEENWKDGASIVDKILDGENRLIAQFYHTPVKLRKSATSKTILEILSGLGDNSIQITFTWALNYKMVFVNFFSTISDASAIEYVNNVYEPCTQDGQPIEAAPPYSYYDITYHKPNPEETPPYLIISREFTNQIYNEWLGRGNQTNFKPKLDALTDDSNLPLRFSYELTES